MRPLRLAALAALAALALATSAARPAVACTVDAAPSAAVLGGPSPSSTRPLLVLARLAPDAPLALTGPDGDVALERRARFARPRTPLTPGAAYRVVVRGGGRDQVLTRFTVAAAPDDRAPAWAGATVRGHGLAPPRTTCEAHAWAATVEVRPGDDGTVPTGYLYVYDRKPRVSAPLLGLRGVVALGPGELRLGRAGADLSFEPTWSASAPPRTLWLAAGDGGGHLDRAIAVSVPRP